MTPRDGDGPPVIIRRARIEDRATLVGIMRRASIHGPPDYADALLAHPELIDVPAEQIADGRVVVATRDAAPRGFAAVLLREHRRAELDAIFVEAAEWRQGIGRLLMGAAEDLGHRLGADVLDVIANRPAEAFYRACGFTVTGTAMTRFAPALTMSKTLRSIRPS